MKINILNIFKIKNHKYFSNKNINIKIKLKIIKLLLVSMLHDSKEVLMLINRDTFNDAITSDTSESRVGFTEEMNYTLKTSNSTFILMHNHPSNSNFTIQDLVVFLDKDRITELFVVTNNCMYIAAIKKNYNIYDIHIKKRLIIFVLNYTRANKLTMHSNAIGIIEKLVKENLIYIEFKNY